MDGLRHDIRDGFNAYEFAASYDGSMLTLTLTEDEMSGMREASKPHRNRTITVEICSSEPKLITLSCGDQIWRGSVVLSGTVNLDPIPLASCDGWITVNAAELSDDRNEGWRNAPCPMPDGDPVGSDGTGATWPDYDGYDPDDPRASKPEPQPEPEPEPTPTPEPEPTMPEPGPTTPQGPRHPFPPQGPAPEPTGPRDLDRLRALLFWVNLSTNEVESIEFGLYHVDYIREAGEEGVCPADTVTYDITVRFPGGALLAQDSGRDSDSGSSGVVTGTVTPPTTFLSDMPQPVYPLSDVRRDSDGLVEVYEQGDDPRFLGSIGGIARRAPQNPTFPGQTGIDDPGGLLGYITEGLDITFSTTPPGCMVRLAFW